MSCNVAAFRRRHTRCSSSAAARKDFQAVASGQVAASLAEAPPYNFRSVEAGRKVLLNYADEIKNLQYTSFFATNKSLAQNRPLFARYMRAIGQGMRWINDPSNERAAIELMVQRLKVDAAIAVQTCRFMIPENQSLRHEGLLTVPAWRK